MKRLAHWSLIVFSLCLLISPAALAQMQTRDQAKEEKIWQQLQKTSPKALDAFKSATAALDRDDDAEAARLYQEVLRQAPDFEPALRRAGMALVATGRRAEGLVLTEKAVKLNRSPENLISHAFALTQIHTGGYEPAPSDLQQAFQLSKEAVRKNDSPDEDYLIALAEFSLYTDHPEDFRNAVTMLQNRFPGLGATHFYNGIRLADEGNFDAAEAELKKAEALGIPAQSTGRILEAIENARESRYFGLGKYFYYAVYLVGAWAAGLLLLFVAGKTLSARTLLSIEQSDPNDIRGEAQAGLRGVYKKVVAFAGVYYYLSQPIVMLLIVLAVGGVGLFFLFLGWIPIKLLLIFAFVALATIFYMIKSLVVRVKAEDPGRVLTEAEAPELWAVVRDVAETLGTRAVDEIRLTHGAELAVYERGGIRARLQDKADRILIIGLATLGGFSQNAFRAVLAHEYGHFSNRDTAGGDIAIRVNNDIVRLAESMAASGTATVYNIAFHFLRFYHFLFRRITHGASRLQEVLADRVAVYHYGADAFREGLTHVIRRDLEFNLVAEKEISAALGGNRALQNLYEMTVQDEGARASLEEEFNEYVSRPTTEDDSHPSPADRFKLAGQIKSKADAAPLGGEVWDLFRDRAGLTLEMNNLLESKLKAIV